MNFFDNCLLGWASFFSCRFSASIFILESAGASQTSIHQNVRLSLCIFAIPNTMLHYSAAKSQGFQKAISYDSYEHSIKQRGKYNPSFTSVGCLLCCFALSFSFARPHAFSQVCRPVPIGRPLSNRSLSNQNLKASNVCVC